VAAAAAAAMLGTGAVNIFHSGNDFLHNRPGEMIYKPLIDGYRHRIDDEVDFCGKLRGVYASDDPARTFERSCERGRGSRV